jgi:hypothetical protein
MYLYIFLYLHPFIDADTTVHLLHKIYQNSRPVPNLAYFVGFYSFQEERELEHPHYLLCSHVRIYRIKDAPCQQKFKK